MHTLWSYEKHDDWVWRLISERDEAIERADVIFTVINENDSIENNALRWIREIVKEF